MTCASLARRGLMLALIAGALPGAHAADSARPAQAAALAPGDTLRALTLEDQHGRAVTLPGTARWLLFASDKAAADLAQAWLTPQGSAVLERRQALYVADISAMPAVITRLVALPKLRELPYSIALVRDADLAADLPRRRGTLTVLRLDRGRVEAVHHAGDAAALQALLDRVPAQDDTPASP